MQLSITPSFLLHTEIYITVRDGIAYSHRIPPVKLKAMSEKRRKEMAGLLGGEQASRQTVKLAGPADPLLRSDARNEKRL